jgi:putative ABC transport system permease protein
MRNKVTSCINILGLIVAFVGSILMITYVVDEWKFDGHHAYKERLYRVVSRYDKDGYDHASALTPAPLAEILQNEFGEVQATTRLMIPDDAFLLSNNDWFKEKIIFTDSAFLNVFDLTLLQGNRLTCLSNHSSILISQSLSVKLFGQDWQLKSIIGSVVKIDGTTSMTVTGVFADMPSHSHFHSSAFATTPAGQNSWMDVRDRVFTYVLIREHSDSDILQNKIEAFISRLDEHHPVAGARYEFQNITDIRLYSDVDEDLASGGKIQEIYTLILITVFLIFSSGINFVNLYTAQTLSRQKEIGVRKVLGALGTQLRLQFMVETSCIVSLSVGFAFLTAYALLPSLNDLAGKTFHATDIFSIPVVLTHLVLAVTTIFIVASYPAIYLSSRKPMEALKEMVSVQGRYGLRKGLIVFQFTLSSIIIILTWIALRQMNFVHHKSLGYDKDRIVIVQNTYMLGNIERIKAFRDALIDMPVVEHVSISGYTPAQDRWEKFRITFAQGGEQSGIPANWMLVDEGFLHTLGIQLLEGRNFSENHSADERSIIINEKAVSALNLRADDQSPLGKALYFKDGDGPAQPFQIIGVVKDFNFSSLHNDVTAVVLRAGYHRFEMAVRFHERASQGEALIEVVDVWKKFAPNIPFEYDFLEERFNLIHKSDSVAASLFLNLSSMTIIISLLGLFCMTTDAFFRRTKEVGIRKVLGATDRNIMWMLLVGFFKLILMACMISVPLGWLLAKAWLNTFAFRVEITWWTFAGTTIGVMILAFLTMSYQVFRASRMNTVKNLQHE